MAISNTTEIEKKLWAAADELRANSKLKASEYSVLVLGLIFLRYADAKFARAEATLNAVGAIYPFLDSPFFLLLVLALFTPFSYSF